MSNYPIFLFLISLIEIFAISDVYAVTAAATLLPPGETNIPNDKIILDNDSTLNLNQTVIDVVEFTETIGTIPVDLTQEVKFIANVPGEPITMQNTQLTTILVEIPDQTTISGPDNWDNTIAPPKIVSTGGTVQSGFQTPTSSIQIGSPDVVLVFDSAVTITFDNTVGQMAYKLPNTDNWVLISTCTGTFANPNAPPSPGECSINDGTKTKILTFHFTEFAGLSTTPSSPPSTPPSVGSGGAGGGGGGGKSGGGGGGSAGGGGGAFSPTAASFDVHLYRVSWNTCDDNIMTITAGPASNWLSVKLRTAKLGLVTATLAKDQPYITKSGLITPSLSEDQPDITKLVFEARIDPTESFVVVQVEGIIARAAQIVKESISLKECSGTIIVEKDPITQEPPPFIQPSKPSNVEFHTTTPRIPGGATFESSYNDINFEINYKMDLGIIKEMYVDEGSASVTFTIDGTKGGEFVLSLPRGLINADNDKFVVFTEDSKQQLVYDVAESTDEYVIIRIMLPDGASKLTILGTSVVPEFASLTVSILMITLVSVIVMTRLKTLQGVM